MSQKHREAALEMRLVAEHAASIGVPRAVAFSIRVVKRRRARKARRLHLQRVRRAGS